MLYIKNLINIQAILLIIVGVIIIGVTISCINFQRKKKKKYEECLKLVKGKENTLMSDERIVTPSNIDTNTLMLELYNIYICFVNNLKNNEKYFDNILDDFLKILYSEKIDRYKLEDTFEIMDKIELIDYSLVDYDDNEIVFRIKINCLNYKMNKGEIISGSRLSKVNQIIILTYIKKDNKWLIKNIEKAYEQKLSE